MSINLNSELLILKNKQLPKSNLEFGKSFLLSNIDSSNSDNEKTHLNLAISKANVNKVRLNVNKSNNLSFGGWGKKLWEGAKSGAKVGAGVGAGVDVAAGGTTLGAGTAVGTAGGAVIGAAGGVIDHFVEKKDNGKKKEEDKLASQLRIFEEQQRQSRELNESLAKRLAELEQREQRIRDEETRAAERRDKELQRFEEQQRQSREDSARNNENLARRLTELEQREQRIKDDEARVAAERTKELRVLEEQRQKLKEDADRATKEVERLKQDLEIKKQQIELDAGQAVETLQRATTEKAEAQRINDINKKYETKALEIKHGYGLGRIAGYEQGKLALNELFISPFLKSQEGEEVAREVPNGILLYGITGNGKTTFARALAEQVLGDKIKTNYHELSGNAVTIVKNLHQIKEKASKEFSETGQRTIVLIDEFDHISLAPDKTGYNGATNGELKAFLDNCSESGITVLATTNHPQNMEEAFIKNKKRFSVQVVIDPPAKQDMGDILKHYLEGITDDTVKHEELANALDEKTKGGEKYTCSAIETIAKQAKSIARAAKRSVSQSDLLNVINMKNNGPDIDKAAMNEFKGIFKYMSRGLSYEEYLARAVR